jgi:aspartate 1-decarboxylase
VRTYLASKIHGITVTNKSVEYHGSVSIDPRLMKQADVEPYEQVSVVNLSNGERWETYALPGDAGEFRLNGGSARLGEVGDACVVMTFQHTDTFEGAAVVFVDADNAVTDSFRYP